MTLDRQKIKLENNIITLNRQENFKSQPEKRLGSLWRLEPTDLWLPNSPTNPQQSLADFYYDYFFPSLF